tara:strand:- start:356 stop:796 length:441 start_codon:yes stop_codon:yes gene_type:complete
MSAFAKSQTFNYRRIQMAAASDYTENLALKWILTTDGPAASARPTAWYLGLYTTDPTDADTGTEVSGNGYTRESVAFTVTTDTAENSATVTFGPATASWGTVTHVGVFDAVTGGELLFHGALTTSKAIATDDSLQVTAGNLTITLA